MYPTTWNHFFKGTSANHKVAISPVQGVSELAAQGHKSDERGHPNQSARPAEHLHISALPILRKLVYLIIYVSSLQIRLRIYKSSEDSLLN